MTLPAKRLYEIIRALPDKEIKFKRGDANWVTVTCGSSRFRIAGLTSGRLSRYCRNQKAKTVTDSRRSSFKADYSNHFCDQY